MMLQMRLVATLALSAGLAFGGAALAQTQAAGAPPPSAPAQSAPPVAPPNLSLPKAADPNGYPTYSVPPPHDSSSGIYLPAVVGGYVKSTAGCVVVGCTDGPSVGGASSSDPDQPPPPATPPASPGSPSPQ